VSILVNNAGIIHRVGLEETTPEIWDQTIDINQRGVLHGIQAVVPGMRRRGGGSIVNIASILGIVASQTSTAYHASKGAVRSLTRQAACEFGAENIRVNSVDPGFIETAILAEMRASGFSFESKTDVIPLRRFGDPREIAYAVLFLASDESSFVTGADLVVDGGMIAGR
jgi:cyclopentanol dehydrogenase